MSDDGEKKKQSPLVWVLGGCAGVTLLGLCAMCVGPGIVSWLFTADLFGSSTTPIAYPPPIPAYDAAGLEGPVLPPISGPVRPAGGVNDVDPLTDLASRRVVFLITRADGARAPAVGTECTASIERRVEGTGGYRCHADVTCGATLLYGGESQGFFPCQLVMDPRRNVTGSDTAMTGGDGDALFEIDTTVDRVHLEDDGGGTLGVYNIDGTVLRIE
jgi:hypothetical protein